VAEDSAVVITTVQPATDPDFLAGFIVGEGCFTGAGRPRTSFTFSVGLGAVDRGMCEALRDFFGCGYIVDAPRRKSHYDDEAAFVVHSLTQLVDVVVPFMAEHLPPSHNVETVACVNMPR